MRKPSFLIICMAAYSLLWGQQQWYTTLPERVGMPLFAKIEPSGVHYNIFTWETLVKIDSAGEILQIGSIRDQDKWPRMLYAREFAGGNGPAPSFLIVVVEVGADTNMVCRMGEFLPGKGWQNSISLPFTPNLVGRGSPVVLPVHDSLYAVFSPDSLWKVAFRPGQSLQVVSQQFTGFTPLTVLEVADAYWLAGQDGQLRKTDPDGNALWTRQHPFDILHDMISVPGGVAACGRINDSTACVMRFNETGDLLWQRVIPSVNRITDIVSRPDGSLAITGSTGGSLEGLPVILLDGQGEELWHRYYTAYPASGLALYALPDGGLIVFGTGGNGLHIIRTDANGQTGDPVPQYPELRLMQTDGLSAGFIPSPCQFYWDGKSSFRSNVSGNPSLLFVATPWLGGKNAEGMIRASADDYLPEFYRMGATATAERDFTKVWRIKRSEIEALQLDFALDGVLDDPVPRDILEWPGRGNPHFQVNHDFSPVLTPASAFPAPFVDADGDGNYNVYNGDYPVMIGDEMVWYVFTDIPESGHSDLAVGADIAVCAYTFDCPGNDALENTIWMDYTVVHRSDIVWDSAYFGVFLDFDLACPQGDYMGTAPQADMLYAYHAGSEDAYCTDIPVLPAEEIPVASWSFVNHSLDYSTLFVTRPGRYMHRPNADIEYFNTLRGHYTPSDIPLVNGYQFTGNPADPAAWSMCTTPIEIPADMTAVGATGPMTFAPGDTLHFRTRISQHPAVPHPCPDINTYLIPDALQMKIWRNDGVLDIYPTLPPVVDLPPGESITLDAGANAQQYQWSTGASTSLLEISAPGSYSVTVTNQAGCQREAAVLVRPGNALAQAEIWSLQPNPLKSRGRIVCPDCPQASELRLEIYNGQGGLVRTVAVEPDGAFQTARLTPGIYWIVLWVDGRRLEGKSMIIGQ